MTNSLEDKTTAELLMMANAGLGFTLNVNSLPAKELLEITNAAALSGAQITLIDEAQKLARESS
ncbi:MAG TPA: hypothetical protein VK958_01760 [Methylophilus sp.]|uniref:hypothetical protein n=1 Tax=Methylophilus sp. TaxID=29541 RepID=UPI002CF0541C|nr:hypothetical protein [Methylophilus sp.]HSH85952.1 hypothetical protein [Methylophilus sp.]